MERAGWTRNPTGRVQINGEPVRGYLRQISPPPPGLPAREKLARDASPLCPGQREQSEGQVAAPPGVPGLTTAAAAVCTSVPPHFETAAMQAQADLALVRART